MITYTPPLSRVRVRGGKQEYDHLNVFRIYGLPTTPPGVITLTPLSRLRRSSHTHPPRVRARGNLRDESYNPSLPPLAELNRCPQCGAIVSERAAWCRRCGYPILPEVGRPMTCDPSGMRDDRLRSPTSTADVARGEPRSLAGSNVTC